jgi:squalene-hopene/tetraprenyl-beta-curcumene cyclase
MRKSYRAPRQRLVSTTQSVENGNSPLSPCRPIGYDLLNEVSTMKRILIIVFLIAPTPLIADEPAKVADNKPDEPRIKAYSLDRAVDFLDAAALEWTRKRECFSCHTNFAFLYARPTVSAKSATHGEIRSALESMVTVRWKEQRPRWDAEVVASAAALAHNDARTAKKLDPTTRMALDRMWTIQRPDGGWNWLICGWPPMENDDHYGVTLAALAVGVAPDNYAATTAAKEGLAKIKAYLQTNSPQNAHHKGMLLWAGSYLPDLVAAPDRDAWIKEIRGLQLPDGGWSAAGLYPWKRGDKKEQTPDVSDGYGTGFAIYTLRQSGIPAADPALQKGIAWLKDNQRESGRWYTRSLFRDGKHYLTHAGTAFAIMAIKSCE